MKLVTFNIIIRRVFRHVVTWRCMSSNIRVIQVILVLIACCLACTTGIFRAPLPGVYMFSWAVTARRDSGVDAYDVWVNLLVNGNTMVGISLSLSFHSVLLEHHGGCIIIRLSYMSRKISNL